MQLWLVKIYRADSQTTVEYERVKHCWWNKHRVFVISQLRDVKKHDHDYIEWPIEMIDHIQIKRVP